MLSLGVEMFTMTTLVNMKGLSTSGFDAIFISECLMAFISRCCELN